MQKWIPTVVTVLLLSACAVSSPGPAQPTFAAATANFPPAQTADFSIPAMWYPNVLLGSTGSFHSTSIEGRLFVTGERLVFAEFDEPSGTYLQAYETPLSAVTWITIKEHGATRILRLQANGTSVHSFGFGDGEARGGAVLPKDRVAAEILARFPKH